MILFKVALRHLLCLIIARKVLFPIKFMTLDQQKKKKNTQTGFTHLYFPEKQRLKILFSSLGDKIKKIIYGLEMQCNILGRYESVGSLQKCFLFI